MKAQSETVGIAVIMLLIMGSIIAYAFMSGPGPERMRSEPIIADNFAYVLLQSDYDTGACTDTMTRILDNYLNRRDPCDFSAPALTDAQVRANISSAIRSVTSQSIDEWGYTYELRISDAFDRSVTRFEMGGCPGFERSGIAIYSFGRPERILEFSICS